MVRINKSLEEIVQCALLLTNPDRQFGQESRHNFLSLFLEAKFLSKGHWLFLDKGSVNCMFMSSPNS